MLRHTYVRLALFLSFCLTVSAQNEESPTPGPRPTTKPRNVRLTFLPPPLDGSISLGIYDAKGKLVRVLHREADFDQFTIGADALQTTWDTKNDQGEEVPPGKYRAHGFAVGDLSIKSVGFFLNDWVASEESPHISRIRNVAIQDDNLLLDVELASGQTASVVYAIATKSLTINDSAAGESTASPTPLSQPDVELIDPIMTVAGKDQTSWVIDRSSKGSTTAAVKQFSASGELLRQLAVPVDQPQPIAVAPSMRENRIYLLEENSSSQRLRGLSFDVAKTENVEELSDWKVDFEKSIVLHHDFSLAGGKPIASESPGNTNATLKVRLQPNPLLNDERTTIELAAGFDSDGSFLKTADGLPLRRVSKTSGTVRTLLAGRGSSGLDFFQDDGAVVQQFRVTGLDRMMSFDCGSFELK